MTRHERVIALFRQFGEDGDYDKEALERAIAQLVPIMPPAEFEEMVLKTLRHPFSAAKNRLPDDPKTGTARFETPEHIEARRAEWTATQVRIEAAIARLDDPDTPTVPDAATVPRTVNTLHTANTVDAAPVPSKARRAPTPDAQAAEDERLAEKIRRFTSFLLPSAPHIIYCGYFVCFNKANWTTGKFTMGEKELSEALGGSGRKSGQRVLKSLERAGLIVALVRGGKHKDGSHPTLYRLMPLGSLNQGRVMAVLCREWANLNPSGWDRQDAKDVAAREADAGT